MCISGFDDIAKDIYALYTISDQQLASSLVFKQGQGLNLNIENWNWNRELYENITVDNNQNKKGVALCVHGGDRDHDHMLHRHHPLLQAGEKNHDGGMLELFMFSPIFVFSYHCQRKESFCRFIRIPSSFSLLFLISLSPSSASSRLERIMLTQHCWGCCASFPYFFIDTIICFN